MCEVTQSNFDDKCEEIFNNIDRCSFIAIDGEFSGLISDSLFEPSLFDTPEERYYKYRNSIQNFTVLQFGISLFHYDLHKCCFICTPYNFYLFPRWHRHISLDDTFLCSTSSITFLDESNFDFNKLFREGISYTNKEQQKKLRNNLNSGSLYEMFRNTCNQYYKSKLQESCSKVAEWAVSAQDGDEFLVEDNNSFMFNYLLHKEIRIRFPALWTCPDESIKVRKVSNTDRKKLEIEEKINNSLETTLQHEMLKSVVGFSKIFDKIVECKKPIVGHNLYLDLMFMYKQFINPLPSDYNIFKYEINQMFPTVFDTKHISYILKDKIKNDCNWEINSVSGLYEFFYSKTLATITSPVIELEDGFNFVENQYHDAQYDSYCTGCIFIRMSHLLCTWDEKRLKYIETHMKDTPNELFAGVNKYKNHINLIRANVHYVNLEGPDPVSSGPPFILVETKRFQQLDIQQITKQFGRFGAVDVKSYSRKKAIVAVGNQKCAKEILNHFKQNKNIRVIEYNFFETSRKLRTILWSSVLLSSTVCAVLLYGRFRKIVKQ